jgi:predicted AAA+ superfamily ATPase
MTTFAKRFVIMIKRILSNEISQKLFKGKAILIFGARQVGKSSLLQESFKDNDDVLWLEGDDIEVQSIFENFSLSIAKSILGNKKILIIDEAQNILNIGLKLKIITDQLKDIQLIATGSSSFDLANKINEPLTGRKWEYTLYPLSFDEMVAHHGFWEEKKQLNQRLVFGYYPDVVTHNENAVTILRSLATSYLYKDILRWENIKKSDRIVKLLQALAFQIGSQVSYSELGNMCGLDNKTVEKYISLLEQAYVIFRLPSFSRNLRNELKFSKKVYFFDNGIRNALIANYNPIELRSDVGALWENFILSERVKKLHYSNIYANQWFWRTQAQKEIDYIEEYNGQIYAYEFKWNNKKTGKIPIDFSKAYPTAKFEVITPDNFQDFISI